MLKDVLRGWGLACLAGALIGLGAGCDRGGGQGAQEVVVYTSVDEPVARPILQEFQRRTGIRVIVQTDTEATKSAGLAERLEAERANPQADVWWGNEVFHTINLANRGVLAAYESPSAEAIPAMYKDGKHRWAGSALRARVIARTMAEPGKGAVASIASIEDLAGPGLKGKVGMARPTAGTTGGHVAALYTLWGRERTEGFLRKLKENEIKLVGGNSIVAEMVGQGEVMWAGLTDNDDVDAMLRQGGRLEMVLPDQGEGQTGTLTIPCTVGLVAGAKRAEAGRKLVDYLLSREVEQNLLDAKFARYSVHAPPGQGGVRAMAVDYAKVAENMKEAVEMAMRVLEGR